MVMMLKLRAEVVPGFLIPTTVISKTVLSATSTGRVTIKVCLLETQVTPATYPDPVESKQGM